MISEGRITIGVLIGTRCVTWLELNPVSLNASPNPGINKTGKIRICLHFNRNTKCRRAAYYTTKSDPGY